MAPTWKDFPVPRNSKAWVPRIGSRSKNLLAQFSRPPLRLKTWPRPGSWDERTAPSVWKSVKDTAKKAAGAVSDATHVRPEPPAELTAAELEPPSAGQDDHDASRAACSRRYQPDPPIGNRRSRWPTSTAMPCDRRSLGQIPAFNDNATRARWSLGRPRSAARATCARRQARKANDIAGSDWSNVGASVRENRPTTSRSWGILAVRRRIHGPARHRGSAVQPARTRDRYHGRRRLPAGSA